MKLEIWKDKVMIQKSIKEKREAGSKNNTMPSNKKATAIKSDSAASYSNTKKTLLAHLWFTACKLQVFLTDKIE